VNNNGLGTLEQQIKVFSSLEDKGLKSMQTLKKIINQPEYHKARKTYLLSDVARIVGISRNSIKERELNGSFEYYLNKNDSDKKHYSLQDINYIRGFYSKGFFNGKVNRPHNLQPAIIAFTMFKGGVGKTTHACHLAAHSAIAGLNTLLIDLDPQASSTFAFGYVPSVDLGQEISLYSALLEDPLAINSVIRSTHYDNLDIITSGLELQGADIALPSSSNFNKNKELLTPPLFRLKHALQKLEKNYDVIILDCAPNHGSITLNAITAANNLILPVTPTMLSFGSSIHFIQTLLELSTTLKEHNEDGSEESSILKERFEINIQELKNNLFRILITNDSSDAESQSLSATLRAMYGNFVMPKSMIRTIALARSSNDMALLYDIKRSEVRKSKESFDRGLAAMKNVNDDIMNLLANNWGLNETNN
jgi:chromosome partitioning protein